MRDRRPRVEGGQATAGVVGQRITPPRLGQQSAPRVGPGLQQRHQGPGGGLRGGGRVGHGAACQAAVQAGADGFGTTATRGTKVITCTIWPISLTTGPVPFPSSAPGKHGIVSPISTAARLAAKNCSTRSGTSSPASKPWDERARDRARQQVWQVPPDPAAPERRGRAPRLREVARRAHSVVATLTAPAAAPRRLQRSGAGPEAQPEPTARTWRNVAAFITSLPGLRPQTERTPAASWPSSGIAGGHEVEAVGVQLDANDAFSSTITYANSWGSGWGLEGRFKMRLRTYEKMNSVDLKQYVI